RRAGVRRAAGDRCGRVRQRAWRAHPGCLTQQSCAHAAAWRNSAIPLRVLADKVESRTKRRAAMSATPRRVENLHTEEGKVPVYATGIVEQPWDDYSADDHATWATLSARQREILPGRASEAFLQAQDAMGMTPDRIPKFSELNEVLREATGWTLMGVEGLLPELDFFEHLANRRFPVTWWIRRPDQIDYIEEPDLFHDLFGHVPLLMTPVFADDREAYGRGGVRAHGIAAGALQNVTRLYWYTVEFGLIRQKDGLRIYGSGIVSSRGESLYSLEANAPNRIGFDLERIMRTRYRIDTYQQTYFVIDSFDQLREASQPDFTQIYARLAAHDSIPACTVLYTDKVFSRGTAEGWSSGGDV